MFLVTRPTLILPPDPKRFFFFKKKKYSGSNKNEIKKIRSPTYPKKKFGHVTRNIHIFYLALNKLFFWPNLSRAYFQRLPHLLENKQM